MKLKQICIAAMLLIIVLSACNREEKPKNGTSYVIIEGTAAESETTISFIETESPETVMGSETGEIPEFLGAVSEEVYLDPDTSLWKNSEKEAALGLYKGFELCELVIQGVRHKAVYNEDGIVIIENRGENNAVENYTVVYNGGQVTVPMGYPLGSDIRVSITLRDIEGDGRDELFIGNSGMEGESSYINVIRLDPVKTVPVEYSSKNVEDSLIGYGIEAVDYKETGEAEAVFYVEDASGNREYGTVVLKNADNPRCEYVMVLREAVSVGFTETDKSSTSLAGMSTFEIRAREEDGSLYHQICGYVFFRQTLEYDENEDRYVSGKTGVLTWKGPEGNEEKIEIGMSQ